MGKIEKGTLCTLLQTVTKSINNCLIIMIYLELHLSNITIHIKIIENNELLYRKKKNEEETT